MTRCPRCGGEAGAHYAACVFANLLQRWLGDDYPLFGPPNPAAHAGLMAEELQGTVAREVDAQLGPLSEIIAELRRELDSAIDAITRPADWSEDEKLTTSDLEESLAQMRRGETTVIREKPEDEGWSTLVRRIRTEAGWSQERMANELGCSRTLIGAWERGNYAPGPDNQKKLLALAAGGPPPPTPEPAKKALPATLLNRNQEDQAAAVEVMKRVIAEHTKPDPDGWMPGPELNRLAKQINPDIHPRYVGGAMRALGYTNKRQFRTPGYITGPTHYQGLTLKTEKEPSLDEQMQQRRAAEQAAKAEMPPPPPKKERYRYDGKRPGAELPAEFRTMLEPLWSTPGWSYSPHNENGGGKPRVTNPGGTSYVLPNTPSDVRAVKNAKSALRRLGAPI